MTVAVQPDVDSKFAVTEPEHYRHSAVLTVLMKDVRVLSSDGACSKGIAVSSFSYVILKRAMDVALAALLLVILAPLFAIISIAVRMDSSGPIFYHERRVGRFGKHFTIYKFRSMYTKEYLCKVLKFRESEGAQLQRRSSHKHVHDPRITRVGSILRKLSLDELPQLFNVLRGDMSLVGPRPVVDAELSIYGNYAVFYKLMYPGVSGLWQVSGRNDVDYPMRVRLDATYCTTWSHMLDLRILLRTIPAVWKGTGAY
jgi:lipopolysaccharide/colanic/teichoic acid biosynthesis glycosyltransferase